MTTMPQPEVLVTVGVDTHADTHVGVALDQLGRDLGTITVETTPCGYRRLLAWASSFGVIDRFGIEGGSHLCGVAPLDASSGKQLRHRLNPGGDRQANSALHTVAIVRLSHDPTTRAYVARRLAEGKTKREAIRCLKRYLARRMYHHLTDPTYQPALDKT
jgi:hypothetical protein